MKEEEIQLLHFYCRNNSGLPCSALTGWLHWLWLTDEDELDCSAPSCMMHMHEPLLERRRVATSGSHTAVTLNQK